VRTVLVVDDEFGVAEVLDAILSDEGYRVITATNGRQALARIAEQRPDLVLLDYMMPILDGVAVLRALSADPTAHNLPVVVMSALPEEAISTETKRYAAFLRKPFRIKTVLAAVACAMPAPNSLRAGDCQLG
jgi:CheY-like chemotaxis protein